MTSALNRFLLEFKSFLENRKEYWTLKQKEAEDRFLQFEQRQVTFKEPKQKKRKKSKKELLRENISEAPFSTYAAELQIQFFVKVNYYYVRNRIVCLSVCMHICMCVRTYACM